MADKTINDLTATTSLNAGDQFELENTGNNSRKITASNLETSLRGLVGGARTLISEQAADSVTTTFSFTSIANSYVGLEIDCNFTVATNSLIIRANNDSSGVAGTSGKYQMQRTGHSNGAINLQQVLQTGWNVSSSLATSAAIDFRLRLLNYALTAKKMAKYDATVGTTGSGNLAIVIAALLWDDTTAISRLDFIFGAAPTGGKIRLFGLS